MIQHLACIMDGNRRWAKQQGLKPWIGHKQGIESIRTVVQFALEQHIPYLSLYAFSLENTKRAPEELSFLFNLFNHIPEKQIQELIEQGVQVRFVGDAGAWSKTVHSTQEIEERTKEGKKLHLSVLLYYGGRQEILHAVKKCLAQVQQGLLRVEEVTQELFASYLWTGNLPDPELIIRTGGLQRLSNFLLYKAAYSELYFLNCLWPDLTKADLTTALQYYVTSKRNFGT